MFKENVDSSLFFDAQEEDNRPGLPLFVVTVRNDAFDVCNHTMTCLDPKGDDMHDATDSDCLPVDTRDVIDLATAAAAAPSATTTTSTCMSRATNQPWYTFWC
jgi:hypothetical protein